ncbi:hypothetical protein LNP17_19125 [Klebsiella variicola subsp. variicola]|nr:hypothetical protein [Klebsiella variicola subsp. variicola]
MRIFIKYSFMSLLFLEAASLQICYASDNSVSSVNSDTNSMTFSEIFSRQEQQRVDEEYRGDYRNYKNKQNNLPDSQRSKVFSSNEYWLVNKETGSMAWACSMEKISKCQQTITRTFLMVGIINNEY